MAEVRNMRATAGTERTTNYSERMFSGVKHKTVELAVQAGAKEYALKELKLALELVHAVAPTVDEKDVLQALYTIKKQNIVNSMERIETRETAFNDLNL